MHVKKFLHFYPFQEFFLEINLYSRLQCIQEHKSFGPNGHPRMKGVGLLRLLLGVSALK